VQPDFDILLLSKFRSFALGPHIEADDDGV
jgi:hypothetical protein